MRVRRTNRSRPPRRIAGFRPLFRVAATAIALSIAWAGRSAPAQGPSDLPAVAADSGEHVFVSGVEDSFEELRAAIARAKKESGRDYRVIVVGEGPDRPAPEVLDGILARWGREHEPGSSPAAFDPSQDYLVYVDVGRRRWAMRAPWSAEAGSGLDEKTIERELVTAVFLPLAREGRIDAALARLVDATERWGRDRLHRERDRREAARVFRTRTLPAAAATLAGLGALGFVVARRARHHRRMREAREKLAAFKAEVVSLSDLLDAQQERHRMLPHSDPDFLTPMAGRTRSAYDGVQTALHGYRERWLSLMDVWEKADETLASEWSLGSARADEAIRLLEAADSRPPLEDVARECRAPLDDLEQAHEKARALAADLATALGTTTGRVEALAGRGRSSAPFREALAEVGRGLDVARTEVETDPVSARARVEEMRAILDATTERVERFEGEDDRRRKAGERLDGVDAAIRGRRAEGWLLREAGADPSTHVSSGRERLGVAAGLLDAGELDAARSAIEEAERHAADGAALLENVVAAKARVEELLPGCVARMESIMAKREATRATLARLDSAYASASWSDVADNPSKADEGLSRARAMVAEAQQSSRPDRQEYFRAVALVEEAVRQLDWVDGCHEAVAERAAELDGLRAELPGKCETVTRRVGALGRRLESQRTDRVRANEQWREADRLVQVARRSLAVDRPDLPRSGQVIEAADAAAAGAERIADDDERLALQAFEGIESADREIRRAAGWYAEGVKPDVRSAAAAIDEAKGLLSRQRYEESIHASAEAERMAREAVADAAREAARRRQARQLEAQRRQMEDSFVRMSRGTGPWVIDLPGGTFSGPDPWRTVQARSPRPEAGPSASGGWNSRTAGGSW